MKTAANPFDWHEATDLIMLDARDMRVAARARRPGYAARFPHQFTIPLTGRLRRSDRAIQDCERQCDWMFCGHSNASQTGLDAWWLIDLNAFRAALIRHGMHSPQIVMGDQANPDGTWFKWFDVRSFPAEPRLVVASGRISEGLR